MRALLVCSALALSVGFAAYAQDRADPSAAPPPGADASATTPKFKTGMVVKDSAGATVGKIAKVGKASGGADTVAVSVDGKTVHVPASTLSVSAGGGEAVSTQTKAEIKAAAGSPGPS